MFIKLATVWLKRVITSRSNCVIYATWMFAKNGGFLTFERSPYRGGLVRASWSPDFKTWFSYHGYDVTGWPRWRMIINQFLFRGYVRKFRRNRSNL